MGERAVLIAGRGQHFAYELATEFAGHGFDIALAGRNPFCSLLHFNFEHFDFMLTRSLYFGKVLCMPKDITNVWREVNAKQLAEVLASIGDQKTMQNFLRDVMTEKEIVEIGARLEAARMLKNGDKYTDITNKTKLSSRTVARISDWLQNGSNGYEAALGTISAHHSHISPASAE